MPNEASCKDIGCARTTEPPQLSSLAGTEDFSVFCKHLLSQYVSLCHLIIVLVIMASRGENRARIHLHTGYWLAALFLDHLHTQRLTLQCRSP